MTQLLPPNLGWHCMNSLEWETIYILWDGSAPFHSVMPSLGMDIIATGTGIGYRSDRFEALMVTYGWELLPTGLPAPLHEAWYTTSPIWYEIGSQYESEGLPDWSKCRVFNGPWAQGGSWPVFWPPA